MNMMTDTKVNFGGHIEQITSMLIAESEFPDGEILSLEMKGNKATYSFMGCERKKCSFDISEVVPDQYVVIVETNKDVFQKTINIGEY